MRFVALGYRKRDDDDGFFASGAGGSFLFPTRRSNNGDGGNNGGSGGRYRGASIAANVCTCYKKSNLGEKLRKLALYAAYQQQFADTQAQVLSFFVTDTQLYTTLQEALSVHQSIRL